MSDTDGSDDLESLRDQLDAEKRASEALRAQYVKALKALRVALQRQAELQALLAELAGHEHSFE
jgi:hypothetical protein